MGLRTTKTLVREGRNLAEFRELSGQMFHASFRNAVLGALFWPFITLLGSIGAGMALWVGGGMVIEKSIDIGTLILFIALAQRFFEPMSELSRVFTDILGGNRLKLHTILVEPLAIFWEIRCFPAESASVSAMARAILRCHSSVMPPK